jgi:hypothetical protein
MIPAPPIGNRFAGTPPTACKAAARLLAGEAQEDRLAPAGLTVNSTSDTPSAADAYLMLREAIDSFNQGNTKAGANLLRSFIHDVSALWGEGIDATLADELITEALRIIHTVE